MINKIKFVEVVAIRPMEAIGVTVAIMMLIVGILLMFPGFHIDATSILISFKSAGKIRIVAGWFIALFGTHLIALTKIKPPRSYSIRSICTFTAFLTFLFLAILRVLDFGFGNLVWIITLILALIEGISYIRLRWGLHG